MKIYKKIFNFLFRIALSVALLAWLYTKIDIKSTKDILYSADIGYILCSLAVFFIVNVILIGRWFVFMNALELDPSFMRAIRYYLAGLFGNLFLPSAIGGDIIKILGMCKDSDQKPKIVASVILDRLSGFASIVLVAFCSFMLGRKYMQGTHLIVPIMTMGGASLVIALILFNHSVFEFICRVFNFFPKIKNALMSLHDNISLMKNKKVEGMKAILLSCLSQIVYASTFFLSAKALHQDISFIYFLIFVPIICVAASFPSIGGLGVREAGAAFLFSKVGIGSGVAVSLSLLSFLFMVVVGLLGGIFYVSTLSSGRVQHHSPDAASGQPEA